MCMWGIKECCYCLYLGLDLDLKESIMLNNNNMREDELYCNRFTIVMDDVHIYSERQIIIIQFKACHCSYSFAENSHMIEDILQVHKSLRTRLDGSSQNSTTCG